MISIRNSIIQHSISGKSKKFPPVDWTKSKILLDKNTYIKPKKSFRSNEKLINKKLHETYDIPKNWNWKKISEVCELISGQHILRNHYNTSKKGISYLTGPDDFGITFPTVSKWTDKPKDLSKKNDVLITVKGAGVGKVNLLNIDSAAISRQLMALRPFALNYDFLYLFLLGEFNNLQKLADWTTVPGIGRESILNLEIPFPPIEFQEIIVKDIQNRLHTLGPIQKNLEEIFKIQSQNSQLLSHLKKSILDVVFSEKFTMTL